jgi:hypothetical protein
VTSEQIDGSGDAEGVLAARTFLGFVDGGEAAGHLVGCFALCVADLDTCRESVNGAVLEGAFVPSPRPTMATRALLGVLRHPSAAFGSVAVLSCLLGVVAVATRKRPRTK